MSGGNNIENTLSTPKLEKPDIRVVLGTTISKIATDYGIRLSFIKDIENNPGIHLGDVFKFEKMNDDSGILRQIRGKTNFSYPLSPEKIYQETEKGPDSFPYIAFKKLTQPHVNKYEIVGKNGEQLSDYPLIVDAANLDLLKKEIDKVSGVFITECSTRSAISDLSCEIISKNGSKGIIEVNSKNWLGFFGKTISLKAIQNLIKGSPESNTIATAMASSIHSYPKQIASK